MSARSRDPLRLDVEPFAREAGELEGHWPLGQLQRLAESAHAEARPAESDSVHWQARGELRPVRGAPPRPWLHVSAQTSLNLQCQRCLQPMAVPLDVSRSFCFVHGETTAAELDAELKSTGKVRGPLHGPEHLLGSNFDWGQDLRYLLRDMRSRTSKEGQKGPRYPAHVHRIQTVPHRTSTRPRRSLLNSRFSPPNRIAISLVLVSPHAPPILTPENFAHS